MDQDNPEQFEPGATDNKLQGFLERLEAQQTLTQHLNEVKDEFRAFLETNGVNFSASETTDEETIDEAKSAPNINLTLLHVVSAKCMIDAVADELPYAKKTFMKKDVQAYLLGLGYSEPWLRLVEQEFEGESLTAEEEIDAVAHFLEERSRLESEYKDRINSLHAEMRQYYIEHSGEQGLPISLEPMLRLLASTRLLGEVRPTFFIDQARDIIDIEGMTSPVWYALIDKFFNVPPDQDKPK